MKRTLFPPNDLDILREVTEHEMAVVDESFESPISVRVAKGHAAKEIFATPEPSLVDLLRAGNALADSVLDAMALNRKRRVLAMQWRTVVAPLNNSRKSE